MLSAVLGSSFSWTNLPNLLAFGQLCLAEIILGFRLFNFVNLGARRHWLSVSRTRLMEGKRSLSAEFQNRIEIQDQICTQFRSSLALQLQQSRQMQHRVTTCKRATAYQYPTTRCKNFDSSFKSPSYCRVRLSISKIALCQ